VSDLKVSLSRQARDELGRADVAPTIYIAMRNPAICKNNDPRSIPWKVMV
jgi:hypothetical protein